MDARHFDALSRALSGSETRRRLLGVLATLPAVGGGLSTSLCQEEADAGDRHQRRKKHHKHGDRGPRKRRKHKRKPRCTPDCAGLCGGAADGCGGTCTGSCPANQICDNEACTACDVCPSGDCTFTTVQAAIDAAAAGVTIRICAGTYVPTTPPTGVAMVTFSKNLTLVGAGMGSDPNTATIFDGALTHRVLFVNRGVTGTLQALTVTRGTDSAGAAMNNLGTMTLARVLVTGNVGVASASGIFNQGKLTLTDSIVRGNEPTGSGGGIFNASVGDLTLERSVIEQNTATSGGGIYNYRGSVALTIKSQVTGNEATTSGGGIQNDGGTVSVSEGSTISGNTPEDCVDASGGTGCPA